MKTANTPADFAPTSNVSRSNRPVENAQYYCDRLNEIKQIPYASGGKSDDEIYSGLAKLGTKAVPCLIEKITDTSPMDDPRSAPIFRGFTVSDCAVFVLLMITEEEWKPDEMFSPEFAKRWKDDGVYAYFAFVENPGNRKKIQRWWLEWEEKNIQK